MVQSATGLGQGTHLSSQRNPDGSQCLGLPDKVSKEGHGPQISDQEKPQVPGPASHLGHSAPAKFRLWVSGGEAPMS